MIEATRNTVAAAQAAEGNLIKAVDAASTAMDRVGTTHLQESLQRLVNAAGGAQQRLAGGRAMAHATLSEALDAFQSFADEMLPPTEPDVTLRLSGPAVTETAVAVVETPPKRRRRKA